MSDTSELIGTGVRGLEAAQRLVEMVAAVGIEKLRSQVEAGQGVCTGRRSDLGDTMASIEECSDSRSKGPLNRWSWWDNAYTSILIRSIRRETQRENQRTITAQQADA